VEEWEPGLRHFLKWGNMNRLSARITLSLLLLALLPVMPARSASTGVLVDFEDLDPVLSNDASLFEGYAGLNWTNFSSLVAPPVNSGIPESGYAAGLVSGIFIAYNKDGGPAEFWAYTPFSFASVHLTAAWLEDLQILVEGFLGPDLRYSRIVEVSPTGPTLFEFNFSGVDRVRFTPFGSTQYYRGGYGTHFVMDDLTIGDEEVTQIDATIDIKPGSAQNPINPGSNGVIPVALLSTPELDAPAMVDPDSLTFGRTGTETSLRGCAVEDIDGDGMPDLICHFLTRRTGFACGDVEGILMGLTNDGIPIIGRDTIIIVPCNKK
jgi:hypothetical protein